MLIRFAEHLRLTPPSRKQSFVIRASCEIENTLNKEQDFSVVIPIPQKTQTQILHKEIEWSDSGIELLKEESYGNSFAFWKGIIEKNSKKQCKYTALVSVIPSIGTPKQMYKSVAYCASQKEPTLKTVSSKDFSCVSATDPRVQKISRDLSYDNPRARKYIRRAYEYVIGNLNYGSPIHGLYSVHDALTRQEVDCGGFSVLLASLLLMRGISARIVSGFFAPSFGRNSMHAWVEACIASNQWFPLDPSSDSLFRQGRALHRSGRFAFVGSDHIVYSHGCDFDFIIGGQHCTAQLLQHPFFVSQKKSISISFHTDIAKL